MTIEKIRTVEVLKQEIKEAIFTYELTDFESFEEVLTLLQENLELTQSDVHLENVRRVFQNVYDYKLWSEIGEVIDSCVVLLKLEEI